ncbi:hypothetical protein [Desulforhabdus sp. TSK]|uniref:hypothetical protein n=1 Tax=Desulforhabdus sp. TSK TaxID=2925014 RepID=UPI001FC7C406|nr:hypothetical protein [Desulforhabdus sp. TSK]GKT09204.1 hypothetical protein DSTSK_25090 [Desulforhabdus sp. TSK]
MKISTILTGRGPRQGSNRDGSARRYFGNLDGTRVRATGHNDQPLFPIDDHRLLFDASTQLAGAMQVCQGTPWPPYGLDACATLLYHAAKRFWKGYGRVNSHFRVAGEKLIETASMIAVDAGQHHRVNRGWVDAEALKII